MDFLSLPASSQQNDSVAIPLGVVLRGVIKGYAPPVPFIIVTLISTFVILIIGRILFAIVEDVFVEIV